MLVCHCHAVCDRAIRKCIRDGARSVDEVGDACGAGTGCGGCVPVIQSLVSAEGGTADAQLWSITRHETAKAA